jgi:hypothetical protein
MKIGKQMGVQHILPKKLCSFVNHVSHIQRVRDNDEERIPYPWCLLIMKLATIVSWSLQPIPMKNNGLLGILWCSQKWQIIHIGRWSKSGYHSFLRIFSQNSGYELVTKYKLFIVLQYILGNVLKIT